MPPPTGDACRVDVRCHGKPECSNAHGRGERAVLVRLGLGAPVDPEDLQEFTQLARLGRRDARRDGHGPARPARSALLHRQRQGRGDARRVADASDADLVLVDHALSPSQERNLEKLTEPARAGSQRPDPRHLRAARPQLRGQARGGAGAAEAHRHPPGARLDPPRAPEGRHRPARSRRDPARDRPAPDRPARARAHQAPGEDRPAARDRPRRRAPRSRCRRSRWSATPTPASPRCSAR